MSIMARNATRLQQMSGLLACIILERKAPATLLILVQATLPAIAVLYCFYAFSVFQIWSHKFPGERLRRTNQACPSNKQRPQITKYVISFNEKESLGSNDNPSLITTSPCSYSNHRFNRAQARVLGNAQWNHSFSTWELITNVKKKQKDWKESSILQEKTRATPFNGALKTEEKVQEMNMDHVYIRFLDFLWGGDLHWTHVHVSLEERDPHTLHSAVAGKERTCKTRGTLH